jgi:hypothetical protein
MTGPLYQSRGFKLTEEASKNKRGRPSGLPLSFEERLGYFAALTPACSLSAAALSVASQGKLLSVLPKCP